MSPQRTKESDKVQIKRPYFRISRHTATDFTIYIWRWEKRSSLARIYTNNIFCFFFLWEVAKADVMCHKTYKMLFRGRYGIHLEVHWMWNYLTSSWWRLKPSVMARLIVSLEFMITSIRLSMLVPPSLTTKPWLSNISIHHSTIFRFNCVRYDTVDTT